MESRASLVCCGQHRHDDVRLSFSLRYSKIISCQHVSKIHAVSIVVIPSMLLSFACGAQVVTIQSCERKHKENVIGKRLRCSVFLDENMAGNMKP